MFSLRNAARERLRTSFYYMTTIRVRKNVPAGLRIFNRYMSGSFEDYLKKEIFPWRDDVCEN
jgi:hypothetical protein